jgi:hypothetical protein
MLIISNGGHEEYAPLLDQQYRVLSSEIGQWCGLKGVGLFRCYVLEMYIAGRGRIIYANFRSSLHRAFIRVGQNATDIQSRIVNQYHVIRNLEK